MSFCIYSYITLAWKLLVLNLYNDFGFKHTLTTKLTTKSQMQNLNRKLIFLDRSHL